MNLQLESIVYTVVFSIAIPEADLREILSLVTQSNIKESSALTAKY